jgi:hypothetical protein
MQKPLRTRPDVPEDEREVSADTVALLHFDLMKQIITLALAVSGGAVTLLQVLVENPASRKLTYVGLAMLVLAAILALVVQEYLVERLGEQTRTMRTVFFVPKRFRAPRTARVERMYFIGSLLAFMGGLLLVVAGVSGAFGQG